MYLIYQIGIRLFYLVIRLAAPFSQRAGRWVYGRRRNMPALNAWQPDESRRTIWMHVSSLGEFEQGRPLIERWKEQFPDDRILLSFFSPSGFDIRKDYPLADLVFYLPPDLRERMNQLVDRIRPDLFILVKYDFWPNLLQVLHNRKVPVYLISARFSRNDYFFRWWGGFFLKQLRAFEGIFVQDESSASLLKDKGFNQVVIAGDTRVDAVMGRTRRQPAAGWQVPADYSVIMGGSTWPEEEQMLASLWRSSEFKDLRSRWRLVIAPHDISGEHLIQIENLFDGQVVRNSSTGGDWTGAFGRQQVILIDSIGLLTTLYRHADIAVIGGGFGKGIHNILEPAAFGIPVVFGPKWTRFKEADDLINLGAAFPVSTVNEFDGQVKKLCSDSIFRAESGDLAVSYMKSQMGSSDLIIRYLLGKW